MISALPIECSNPNGQSLSSLPRILLVVDQFPRTLGGGERIVLKLASLLPKYGYRASILTFSVHPECTALTASPCPIYVLPLQRTYGLAALRAAFEFRRFLSAQQIKIVQTFFESSDIWAGFVTKAMSSAKLIWSRRDMGILRTGKHHAAYRLMAGVPDAVFAVSEQVRRYCIDVDRIDPGRVKTIYNGLDLRDWNTAQRIARPSAGKIVATVGNIRRVKGHDILIKAAASLALTYPKLSFSIAGAILEKDYFAELQNLLSELKISDRFHFPGNVSNLREYLASTDIFVLPSRSEGFSNALIEAMAASLPIVATNVGGNSEAVQEGVNGFLIPPEDPGALAEAIARLLSNPSMAESMGQAGKTLAVEHFTVEAMMTQITSVYEELLSGK